MTLVQKVNKNVSPLIKMKLINYEKNKELLEKVPHVRVPDLAVVFMAVLKSEYNDGFATILIHNSHLDFWNMTTEDLYELAKANMANDFEITKRRSGRADRSTAKKIHQTETG